MGDPAKGKDIGYSLDRGEEYCAYSFAG